MKYLFLILFLLTSCGPTSIEKSSSQGVTSGQSGLIMSILLQTTSPSSNPTPSFLIQGNFLIGNTITLHQNSSCTSPVGEAIAQNTYSVNLTTNQLTEDKLYTFYANVTSRTGTVSACSTVSATYNFQTGSGKVSLQVLTPSGPSLKPIVSVNNIQLGATVELYLNSNCTGYLAGQQSFVSSVATQITATLPTGSKDSSYQFWARQILGGPPGTCSGPSNGYALNTKPGYVQVLNASPGKVFKPTVRVGNGTQVGEALVPGALVKLYQDDPTCSSATFVGEKQASGSQVSVDITSTKSLPADGTYTYYATQTFSEHLSPCSIVYGTYQLKTSPTITLVSPTPGGNPFPEFSISGMIPGATAILYQGGCDEINRVGTSTVSTEQVVNVRPTNPLETSGIHTFYAKQETITSYSGSARNPTSFRSPCSENFAQYNFVESRVLITSPNPGNIISPTLKLSELDSNASNTVTIFSTSNCTAGTEIITAKPTGGQSPFSLVIPSNLLLVDNTYSFSAKQSMGANATLCLGSANYVLDTKPNNFKHVTPTTLVGNIATPTFSVSNIANYATPTVTLHTMNDCSEPAVATATGISPTVNLTLGSPITSEGQKVFYAKQTISGHTPKCSSENINYDYNIRPTKISVVGPTSGQNPTPTIQIGGVLGGSKVQIFTGNLTCDTLMGEGYVATGTTSVNVTSNPLPTSAQGNIKYFAKQIINGNGLTSNCSLVSATYNLNTYITSVKIQTSSGTATSTTGSSNVPGIIVEGFAASATVKLFSDSFCTIQVGQGTIPPGYTSKTFLITSNPLNSEGNNLFYANQNIGSYVGPCSGQNNTFATYNLNSKPPPPTLLTSSPGTTLTPAVTAKNIIPGALIELFIDNKCSIPVGSATAVTTQVIVQVSPSNPLLTDGSYYFYLRQINNGHISPCSDPSPTSYFLDTKPSSITVVNPPNEILPEPSWNIVNPTIRVSGVVPGANVVLYKDTSCSLVIGSGVPTSSFVDIIVDNGGFPTDGKYPLYTRQSYGGHTSFCSGDTDPPVSGEYNLVTRPSLSLVGPNPNVLLKPSVIVSNTVNGAFVQLFSSSSCSSGSEISDFAISSGGDLSIKVNQGFTVNGINEIYSKQAVPRIGGVTLQQSPCSEKLDYNLAAIPVMANSTPTPSNIANPSFTLSNLLVESDIGSKTVAIFSDENCTFQVSPTTSIVAPTMTVSIDPITTAGTYTYYSKQEATDPSFISPCSSPGTKYSYDLTPVVSMVTQSPDDEITPTIKIANLVASATVQIFSDKFCSVFVQNAGVAATDTMNVTLSSELPSDGLYNFYANQIIGSVTSSCSNVFATYSLVTNDFQITPPDSPSTSTTPTIIVSNIEVGNIVVLYSDSTCSTVASAPSIPAIGTSVEVVSYPLNPLNVNFQWWARREIGTSFVSPCGGPSSTYVLNTMPSSVTLVGSSPGTNLSPKFQVGGVNNNATVTLYSDNQCTIGFEKGSAIATSSSVQVTLNPPMSADGTISIWARQLSNGNLSPCSSASATYELDTQPTSLTKVSSGTSSPTPSYLVTGLEPGATVNIYLNDPSCNSTVMGTSVVANNATSTTVTSFPISSDGDYYFYAKQTYANTNPPFVSSCSFASPLYPLNSQPTVLKLLSTDPTSSPTPKILVEGVASGDWVYLFQDSTCSSVSGSNIALGSSVQIQTLPALTSSGTYEYFAKRIQGGGQGLRSGCSSAFVELDFNPSYFSKWQYNTSFTKGPSDALDFYGESVSTINNYAVVGVPGDNGGRGSVRLYFYDGFSWNSVGSLTNNALIPLDFYGKTVDISTSSSSGNITNGDVLIVGAPGPADLSRRGKAFIYTYSNGVWINEFQLNPSGILLGDNFGFSVGINKNMAVVGAPSANARTGTVRYFRGINGTYTSESYVNPPASIQPGDEFGFAVSVLGSNFVVSAPSGSTKTVQTYNATTGTPVAGPAISSTTDEFGFSIGLATDNLIVGAPGANLEEGAAYIYRTTDYNLVSTLTSSAPSPGYRFGESVSINGTVAIVGEPASGSSPPVPGQAWIFPGPTFQPSLGVALPQITNDANDQFGAAVDIFGNGIIIGAPGVDPANSGGATYLYRDN